MVSDPIELLAKSICQKENYSFQAPCGAGAFKRTFRVSNGKEDLALKIIVGVISPERIAREINALKKCDHPNISKLLSVGEHDLNGTKVVYLTEEYLPGGMLTDRLKAAALSLTVGKAFALAMVDAIDHLRSHSIVHRDIKPDNVMYRADGTPVLVDLGIARVLSQPSLTQDHLARGPGTPIFASPEQLVNDKYLIDWRADQFSLGITLSIAILGIHPYAVSNNHGETIDRMSQRMATSTQFDTAASANSLAMLKQMVEPWPIKRFRTAHELRQAWSAP